MIFTLPSYYPSHEIEISLEEYKRIAKSYLLNCFYPIPDDEVSFSVLLDTLGIHSDGDWEQCQDSLPRNAMDYLVKASTEYYRAIENGTEEVSAMHLFGNALEKALKVFYFVKENTFAFFEKEGGRILDALFESLEKPVRIYLYRLLLADDQCPDLLIGRLEEEIDRNVKNKRKQIKEHSPNEPITLLLKLYQNKKSRKVTEAAKKLRRRFDGQSYQVQKAILSAFLSGSQNDVNWAANRLKERWIPSLEEDVANCCIRTGLSTISKVAVKNCSTDWIKQHQDKLEEYAGYKLICLRLNDDPSFQIDESKLSPVQYLSVMAQLGKSVEPKVAESKWRAFVQGLERMDIYFLSFEFVYCRPRDIMVWALGRLGMSELLMKIHEMEVQARKLASGNPPFESEPDFLCYLQRLIVTEDDLENGSRQEKNIFQEDLPIEYSPILKTILSDAPWSIESGQKYVHDLSVDIKNAIVETFPKPLFDVQAQWYYFVETYRVGKPFFSVLFNAAISQGEAYYIVLIRLKFFVEGEAYQFMESEADTLRKDFANLSGWPFVFIESEYQMEDYEIFGGASNAI